MPATRATRSLRAVVADERDETMQRVRSVLELLGHQLVGSAVDLDEAARAATRHEADVAVVAVHADPGHALELVEHLNDAGPCPVVLILDEDDSGLIAAAADRGLDAFSSGSDPEGLQAAIELAIRRDEQALSLLTDLGDGNPRALRRQTIDRATGVLMERLNLEGDAAYQHLRSEARRTRTALIVLAESVIRARALLPSPAQED